MDKPRKTTDWEFQFCILSVFRISLKKFLAWLCDIILIAMFFFVSFLVLAPQNLQLLNSTENSLAVSWDPMIDVDNYLISYYPVGYETLMKQVHVPEGQLSYEIVGLRPGTAYNVTLHHVKKGIASEPKYLEASTGRSRQYFSSKSEVVDL